MNRRLGIIKNTLLFGKFGGSPVLWAKNVLAPTCEKLAGLKIDSIEQDGNFYSISLRGEDGVLWIHKSVNLHNVKQVIAEQLYPWMWHYYEVPETKVEQGAVVFDCGCAEGLFSFLVRKRAGKVYAFEPLVDFQEGLERTFLSSKQIEIVVEALGETPGKVFFSKEGTGSAVTDQDTGYTVKMNTIDAFCQERNTPIDYLKADIEGFEQNLLNGANESISKWKPKIAITVYHGPNDAVYMQKYLKRLVPQYKFRLKGLTEVKHKAVMLHAWI